MRLPEEEGKEKAGSKRRGSSLNGGAGLLRGPRRGPQRVGSGCQEGIPAPGHALSPGPQSRSGRGGRQSLQGSQARLRGPERRAETRRIRSVRPCRRRSGRRRRRLRGPFQHDFRRHLRRSVRRPARRRQPAPPGRQSALPAGPGLYPGHLRRRSADHHTAHGGLFHLFRLRRPCGNRIEHLRALRRQRPDPGPAGNLLHPADLRGMRGRGAGRVRSLRGLFRQRHGPQERGDFSQGAAGRGHGRPFSGARQGQCRETRRSRRRPAGGDECPAASLL